jgi:flavin reductase (DIM6/NTAB) family NADH-FMN oxidoreductase RutF
MKRSLGRKTLVVPAPVWVVGTYDDEEKPNIMTAAWGGICCSKPPAVCVSLREATYTYGNIVARQAFTVNVPSVDFARQVDYVGIASGRDENKFDAARLTPVRSELLDAPYVAEFPLNLECKLIHTLKIGLHTLFVGEIVNVKADEAVLNENDRPAIEKVRPLVFSVGEQSYHTIGEPVGPAFSMGKELEQK